MRIIKVEPLSGYELRVTFSNREVKVVDLTDKLKNAKGIFLPLKDVEYFKQVTVDDCQLSICWPNGADMCPDMLYEMGESVKQSPERKRTKKRAASISKKRISRKGRAGAA